MKTYQRQKRPLKFIVLTGGILFTLISCGNSDSTSQQAARFWLRPDAPKVAPVFLEISDATVVAEAEALLQSGEVRWVTGVVRSGDGSFNVPWHWHFDPATISFAEVTIEACQTSTTDLEQNLEYWISFGRTCILTAIEARER